jgi:predicted TIM-barrel fold metal-dependent hydrolase
MKPCRPYDTQPVKPSWVPPPLACDAHCHIFGPADRFPYAPDRTYTPTDAGYDHLRGLHDFLGFERAVLVQASCHGADNSAMLDAIARSGGRYKGVAMVDPGMSDAALALLHAGGVRGVRFNFVKHLGGAPDMDFFRDTVSRLVALGWHLQLHFDAVDIPQYRPLLDALPVPFIIDHMARVKAGAGTGQPSFVQLLDLMRSNPRAWVKISGSERVSVGKTPFDDAIPFARALVEVAPDRVLWGTDFPHPNISADMPNDGELVNLFARTVTDDALRRQVLVDNPGALYWAD